MYQSIKNFNIPPGQPPGIRCLEFLVGQIPTSWAKMLFKCPTLIRAHTMQLNALTPGLNMKKKQWKRKIKTNYPQMNTLSFYCTKNDSKKSDLIFTRDTLSLPLV